MKSGNSIIDCCIPNPELDKQVKDMMNQQIPDAKTRKEFMKNNGFPPISPKSPSLTDMLGGPSITSQLGPILSGVSKMISTLPTKTKLEGNINGGNFSIEVVDMETRNIAISILTNMKFDKPSSSMATKKEKKN